MTSWAWSWDGGPAFAVHATLGSVIAHEILHAFDFHRRKLPMELDQNIDEWLHVTADSWKRLETKIECVARLYARSFWRKVQSYGNDVAVEVSSRWILRWNLRHQWEMIEIINSMSNRYRWECSWISRINESRNISLFSLLILSHSLIGTWQKTRTSRILVLCKLPTRLGTFWQMGRIGAFPDWRDFDRVSFSS